MISKRLHQTRVALSGTVAVLAACRVDCPPRIISGRFPRDTGNQHRLPLSRVFHDSRPNQPAWKSIFATPRQNSMIMGTHLEISLSSANLYNIYPKSTSNEWTGVTTPITTPSFADIRRPAPLLTERGRERSNRVAHSGARHRSHRLPRTFHCWPIGWAEPADTCSPATKTVPIRS